MLQSMGSQRVRHDWATEQMIFPVVMYGCEIWTIKKTECWRIDAFKLVLEKTFESPLDNKEIKPVNPKGNEPWIFIGRTDAEAEAPIIWPHDAKSWLTGEDPDAGKEWRQEEKVMTEDEMMGWHHQINGHEWTSSRKYWWTGNWCAAVHGVTKSWTLLSNNEGPQHLTSNWKYS